MTLEQTGMDKLDDMVRLVLAVPNSVVKERLEKHRQEAALNPKKRGPKRKDQS